MSQTPRLHELQRRVQRDPASISFAALAEEYRRLGMFTEAIDACRAGLQRHPSYTSARVTLGRALVEVGEYDEASVELEQVLRSAPENLAAIRALADIHRRRSEMSDADHYKASLPSTNPTLTASSSPASSPAVSPAVSPPFSTSASEAAPSVAEAPSVPVRIAVQSRKVTIDSEPPALVELEAFLAAIERARRDVTLQAHR